MYTKGEIFKEAKLQLAIDYNCSISDLEKEGNTVTKNMLLEGRRIYESDGCFLKILCLKGRAVISASPEIIPWCSEKLLKMDGAWFFEYPKLRFIDKKLNEFGHEIADIHEYFLPDPKVTVSKPDFKVKWYEKNEILKFKGDDRFDEAFAFDENHPDMLSVAAFDGDRIMGMAGASSDSSKMWQIGINVLPEYEGRKVGTGLVSLLKDEVLRRGKVPFYGTAQSHLNSKNVAYNAGFFPAWVEMHSNKIKKH